MYKEIEKWINSEQKYKEGVTLYVIYGSNPRLKALFSKSETAYNREKLLIELKALLKSKRPAETIFTPAPLIQREPVYVKTDMTERALDELWSIYKDLEIERNKLSNYYHTLIKAKASKEDMKKHYEKIEAKSQEMMRTWRKIKGREEKDEDDKTLEDLQLERKRLKDQKYKIKVKLENTIKFPEGSAKRQLLQQEVAIVQAQYDSVKDKIKVF